MRKRTRRKIRSPIKGQILTLLLAGVAMGLTRSVGTQAYILKQIPKELRKVRRGYLYRVLHEFKYDRLVDYRETDEGEVRIVLAEAGRIKALRFDLDRLEIRKPRSWDKRWRLVMYDVPEKFKNAREALRDKLQELGFYELQKSVFAYPHPCEDEINFIVEVFNIRSFVTLVEVTSITNEAKLRLKFDL